MKKRLWLMLTIASGVSLSGAAAPGGWTTVYAAQPTLTQGARGEAVAELQAALNRLGYPVGTVDGIFGPMTRSAVMAFQRAKHLTADGVVGAQTWAALGQVLSAPSGSAVSTSRSGTAVVRTSLVGPAMPTQTASIPYPGMLLRIGSNGAAVKVLQQRLNQLGFHCGTADGVFGSATQAAVQAFQRSQHLTADGVVGPATWAKLFPQPAISLKSPQSPAPGKTSRGLTSGTASGSASRTSRSGGTMPSTGPSGNQSTSGNGAGNGAGGTSGSSNGAGPTGSSTNAPAYVEVHMRLGLGTNGPAVMSGFQTLNDAAAKAAADAKDDLSHRLPPEAFVVKAADQTLQTLPTDYFYLSPSGQWMHHGQDWTNTIFNVSVGQAPAWARKGELYVGLDSGEPPFYAHFYRIGTFDPSAGVPSQATSIRLAIQDEGVYENPYRSVDLRYPAGQVTGSVIDQWLSAQGSPLVGLGSAFVNAQSLYGVNAVYLAAHAVHESGPVRLWTASSFPVQRNNLFGYQAYDNNTAAAAVFPSEEYSIRFEAWFVRNWYLNPGAVYSFNWPTLDGMNQYYATDRNWSSAVATYMEFLADSAGLSPQNFTSYSASAAAPEPSREREPVYLLGPASAVIAQDVQAPSDYQMRPELVRGAQGYWVRQLQTQLNNYFQKTQGVQPLAVDGDFGSSTLDRLKMFQHSVGLTADGDCGPRTWAALFPTQSVTLQKGTAVTVDQIELGTGGLMYHVTTPQGQTGWVDGNHLTLKNVYKVKFSAPYNVQVPGTEDMLHAGDWVVLSGNQLWYVDQVSGTVKSAKVDPAWAAAWLVQVTQA